MLIAADEVLEKELLIISDRKKGSSNLAHGINICETSTSQGSHGSRSLSSTTKPLSNSKIGAAVAGEWPPTALFKQIKQEKPIDTTASPM